MKFVSEEPNERDIVHRLASVADLAVAQKKEWGEILTGFEGQNRYVVLDQSGNELFYAVEEPRSVLARIFRLSTPLVKRASSVPSIPPTDSEPTNSGPMVKSW